MILSIARREVVTADIRENIRDAAEMMRTYNVGCVVVLHNDKPVGLITDRDLAMFALTGRRDGEPLADVKVRDVMSRPLQTIREDEGFDKALSLMRSAGVRRLPIVDRHGKLRGVVTLDDVLETLAQGMRSIADLLKRQRRAPRRGAPAKEEAAVSA